MMFNVLILGILSCISGILYRLGGVGKPYPTKCRDWGCSVISLVTLAFLFHRVYIFVYFLCFLLSWIFLSTHWKKKGTDAKWWNWLLHGVGIGLATIPCMFFCINLYAICMRAVVLGLAMMLWSEYNSNVVWEEVGRGALIILTLPILLI